MSRSFVPMFVPVPMLLPVLGCLLGVLTMGSPWLVLSIGLAIAALAWWLVVRALIHNVTLHGTNVTATCLAALGGCYGYVAGVLVGRDGTAPLAAWLIAFAAGLTASVLARHRAVYVARMARALESSSTPARGEGRAVA